MYPYEYLDPQRRNIRLLTMLPVKGDEIISCHLETVSLDDLPQYTTLSYVWGDPADTQPILLAGHSQNVTVNLECALRNLAHKACEPRKFWIDALCVNQDNTTERSQQVGLMNAIYKQSGNAIAWLGEWDLGIPFNTNAIQATYAYLEDLASNKHLRHIPLHWNPDHLYDKSRRSEVCSIIGLLGSRSYWNRAWIVQEFVLPNHTEMVCGPFSIDRDLLARALDNLVQHSISCCHADPPAEDLARLRKVMFTLDEKLKPLASVSDRRIQGEMMNTFTLWELLCTFHNTESSDHRDKIFAFLGLARVRPGYQPLSPDYTSTTEDLYSEVGRRMFDESGSLLILTQCTQKACYPQLPSWIPDWTATETSDPYFPGWCQLQAHLFGAPGPIPAYAVISNDSRFLMIQAVKIGTVKNVTNPDATAPARTLVLWENIVLASLPVYGSTAERISASRKWGQKLMRTAIRDQISTLSKPPSKKRVSYGRYRRVRDEDLNVLDIFLAQVKAGVDIETIGKHPDPLYRELHTSLGVKRVRGDKLLILDQNIIGLGRNAQEGDEVWIMPFSPVPIVLRPLKTNASDGGEPSRLHQLVGDCYVDGIMDGEAAENYEEKLETVCIA